MLPGNQNVGKQGAGLDYVSRLSAEMLANVYDLGFLAASDRQSIVLDCGANIGFFSRFAMESGAGRVSLVGKWVGDRETVPAFSTTNVRNPGGHHIVENGPGNIRIPVTSIDQVCDELAMPRIDYIKMDVEGAEVQALAGAAGVIGRFRPRLCIATEHTSDLFANAVAVIEMVRKIDPSYRYLCNEAHLWPSPSRGPVLTPFSLLFY